MVSNMLNEADKPVYQVCTTTSERLFVVLDLLMLELCVLNRSCFLWG